MLRNLKDLSGQTLAASDGDIGHVKDCYFDDHTWALRYLVVDTGSWLTGRQVLISPHAFGPFDWDNNIFQLNLTKQQIEASPSIEMHQPVSRHYEMDYYRYYGWPAYWEGGDVWGLGAYPLVAPPRQEELAAHLRVKHRADKHLQSTHAIAGYDIQATDGALGTVHDFQVDDKSWIIRDVVVDTGHWYAGKEVLIPTSKVTRISYEESTITVTLTQTDIRHTADHKVVHASNGEPTEFPKE